MSSVLFMSALEDEANGDIAFGSDSFKAMLVGAGYAADKFRHARRDDVSNEITGGGYTAGGKAISVSIVRDAVNNSIDVTLGGANWTDSTITARGAVYYKSRGGAAFADELVAYIDFGSNIASTSGLFILNPSTIRFQN